MSLALLIDFGSTYTKLRALDLAGGHVVGTAQGPSTVATDVNIGLDAALAALSRAMGGLRASRTGSPAAAPPVACGWSPWGWCASCTAEAARQVALGAGARLVASFAYRLTSGDVARIVAEVAGHPVAVRRHRWRQQRRRAAQRAALAGSALQCTVVVACNREATDDVMAVLADAGKPALASANVLPGLDLLDIEPARSAIRDVFMRRIVAA